MLAVVLAYVCVRFGTPVVLMAWFTVAWNGASPWETVGVAALAGYVYGVAAVAVWYAVRPFPHGGPVLAGLVAPAVLVSAAWIGYHAVIQLRAGNEDRKRVAAAARTWEERPAPPDAFTIPIPSGDGLLADSREGVQESTDGGESWTPVAERFAGSGIERWARIGGSVFAATSVRLYRSDDGGRTWALLGVPYLRDGRVTSMREGAPRKGPVTALEVVDSALYVASGGVYRSDDLGESWSLLHGGGRAAAVRSMTVVGDTIVVGTSRSGLLRSEDGGASWSRVEGFPHPLVTSLASHGPERYAIGYRKDESSSQSAVDVLRSTDGGDRWAVVNDGLTGRPKKLVGEVDGAMVLLTTLGVFSLEPDETTWETFPYPGERADIPLDVGGSFGLSGGELFRLVQGRLYRFRGRWGAPPPGSDPGARRSGPSRDQERPLGSEERPLGTRGSPSSEAAPRSTRATSGLTSQAATRAASGPSGPAPRAMEPPMGAREGEPLAASSPRSGG